MSVLSEDTKTVLRFLSTAQSTEVSAGDIVRATGLTDDRLRSAAVPDLVATLEWSSAYALVRYGLTPDGWQAARALAR